MNDQRGTLTGAATLAYHIYGDSVKKNFGNRKKSAQNQGS
jgi:hypothetical protein